MPLGGSEFTASDIPSSSKSASTQLVMLLTQVASQKVTNLVVCERPKWWVLHEYKNRSRICAHY